MAIDTGDLSEKAYKAILAEAERFHHDLTLQFGLLSDECDDEAMFIRMSEKLVHEMLTYDESELEDIFFVNPPIRKDFDDALKRILANISKLSK
jgi:hypothetical protein